MSSSEDVTFQISSFVLFARECASALPCGAAVVDRQISGRCSSYPTAELVAERERACSLGSGLLLVAPPRNPSPHPNSCCSIASSSVVVLRRLRTRRVSPCPRRPARVDRLLTERRSIQLELLERRVADSMTSGNFDRGRTGMPAGSRPPERLLAMCSITTLSLPPENSSTAVRTAATSPKDVAHSIRTRQDERSALHRLLPVRGSGFGVLGLSANPVQSALHLALGRTNTRTGVFRQGADVDGCRPANRSIVIGPVHQRMLEQVMSNF